MNITKAELEKLIVDYAESKLGESLKIKALSFHEKGFYSTRINWDELKDISIDVEF